MRAEFKFLGKKGIGGVAGAINGYSNSPPLPQQPVTKEMHLNAECCVTMDTKVCVGGGWLNDT